MFSSSCQCFLSSEGEQYVLKTACVCVCDVRYCLSNEDEWNVIRVKRGGRTNCCCTNRNNSKARCLFSYSHLDGVKPVKYGNQLERESSFFTLGIVVWHNNLNSRSIYQVINALEKPSKVWSNGFTPKHNILRSYLFNKGCVLCFFHLFIDMFSTPA